MAECGIIVHCLFTNNGCIYAKAIALLSFILSHICTVTDHGVSNIEITLEEGLQDIPPLVGEIQERLQSERVCMCLWYNDDIMVLCSNGLHCRC